MTTVPIQDSLQKIGLSSDQAAVYLYLLRNGALPANLLSKRLGITRSLIYKIIDDLIKIDLVRKDDSFKVTRFTAAHPFALRKIAEQEKVAAETLSQTIETTLTPLLSEFNLHAHKPAVHFTEGLAGVSEVLEDTLTAKETIYMYVDSHTIEKEVLDIDELYVKKRLKKEITKKMLMVDTPEARTYAENNQSDLTQIKLIQAENLTNFYAVMNIYDNKVTYISYQNGIFSSVIMHDPAVYTMQRFAFEALWRCAS